jgi:type VI secretion system secreted protein VgrG
MRAPKDMNVKVANDQSAFIGNSNTEVVENDETVQIGGSADYTIGARMEPSVGNNQKWEVTGNRTKKVGKGDTNAIGGNHELKVTGNHEMKVFADVNCAADNLKETITGSLTEQYKQKHTTEIGGKMDYVIGGKLEQNAKSGKSEMNTKNRTENITAQHRIKAGQEIQWRFDKKRVTTVKGSVLASCKDVFTLTGAKQMITFSASAEWIANQDLTLVVTDSAAEGEKAGETVKDGPNTSWILLKDGEITMKAVDNVKIDIAGTGNQGSNEATQI